MNEMCFFSVLCVFNHALLRSFQPKTSSQPSLASSQFAEMAFFDGFAARWGFSLRRLSGPQFFLFSCNMEGVWFECMVLFHIEAALVPRAAGATLAQLGEEAGRSKGADFVFESRMFPYSHPQSRCPVRPTSSGT